MDTLLNALNIEISRLYGQETCETLGRDIGFRLAMRFAVTPTTLAASEAATPSSASSAASPPLLLSPFSKSLDVMKFFSKDGWMALYGKKIDRLQTNHRGVFMLTDSSFTPIAKLSRDHPDTSRYLALHRGIVRGFLMNMGLEVLDVSVQVLPAAPVNAPIPSTEGIAPSALPLVPPAATNGCCFTVTIANTG